MMQRYAVLYSRDKGGIIIIVIIIIIIIIKIIYLHCQHGKKPKP